MTSDPDPKHAAQGRPRMTIVAVMTCGEDARPLDGRMWDYALHEDGTVKTPSGFVANRLSMERVRQIRAQMNFGTPSDAMWWAFALEQANREATARDGRKR